jgi:hypothetical protein
MVAQVLSKGPFFLCEKDEVKIMLKFFFPHMQG